MIKTFVIIFVLFAMYGVFTHHLGAAALALMSAGVFVLAEREFEKRDAEYRADPKFAKEVPDTLRKLAEHSTEASGSRF